MEDAYACPTRAAHLCGALHHVGAVPGTLLLVRTTRALFVHVTCVNKGAMLQRKLQALGYPHAENFDPMSEFSFSCFFIAPDVHGAT